MHPALREGAGDEHLLALLAVDMIKTGLEQGRTVVVEQRLAGMVALGDLAAPRVALRADLLLLALLL
ncbi:hypothetical protein D3C78_1800210 [compost metagenome]